MPSNKVDHLALESTHYNPARPILTKHVTATPGFREAVGEPAKEFVGGIAESTPVPNTHLTLPTKAEH